MEMTAFKLGKQSLKGIWVAAAIGLVEVYKIEFKLKSHYRKNR